MSNPPTRLILASTSPRRARLLRDAGIAFEQHVPLFDDSAAHLPDTSPARAAEALAYLKAGSVADRASSGLVIGCDTVLALGDRRIGKPRDRDDAATMLDELFSQPHQAISAVALLDVAGAGPIIFHDMAEVRIERPSDDALAAYLESDAWVGKAGGYNLAELESQWRFVVTGDPTTVVGLPMRKLTACLNDIARRTQ